MYYVIQDVYIEILSAAGTELDLELQATLQLNYCYSEQFMIEHWSFLTYWTVSRFSGTTMALQLIGPEPTHHWNNKEEDSFYL